MGKEETRINKKILISTLLVSVVALLVCSPIAYSNETALCIKKEPICWDDYYGIRYSSNPPYYVGNKYYWWIKITVTAGPDLEGVTVYDRLGGEFMIEGISIGYPPKQPDLPGYPSPFRPGGPTPDPDRYKDFDYTFDYTDGDYDWPEWGDEVVVNGETGLVDKDGVEFGDFEIFWTGKSCKAHFMWKIGHMDAHTTEVIYLVISTDMNPAKVPKQEFTSPGTYFLNSGATVKGLVDGRQVSSEAEPIEIVVEED